MRKGCFYFIWNSLAKVLHWLPQHLEPTCPSLLHVEGAHSIMCLPTGLWKAWARGLGPAPVSCSVSVGGGTQWVAAAQIIPDRVYNHCDYYYYYARTSRQQSREAHFKANSSLVLIHKVWDYPISACDWGNPVNLCSVKSFVQKILFPVTFLTSDRGQQSPWKQRPSPYLVVCNPLDPDLQQFSADNSLW